MKPLLSAHKRIFFSPQEIRKTESSANAFLLVVFFEHHQSQWLLQDTKSFFFFLISFCLCFFICCLFVFFACFMNLLWLLFSVKPHHYQHVFYDLRSWDFFNWLQTEKATPPPRRLSLLTHRIISAWHNSGPDLQSAPTPWMLDASAPIRGSQLLLACFACFGSWCPPGSCVRVVVEFVPRCSCYLCFVCDWPLAAEAALHCEVRATLWSFYWITTVLNVWYFFFVPPFSWLKPYWYSAHRLIWIQMCCVRIGRLFFVFF